MGRSWRRLLGHCLQRTDPRAAEAELDSPLAAFVRCGSRFRAAQTRLSLARVLAETDAAAASGEEAAAFAQLAGMGAAVPGSPTRSEDGLTPREEEVLGLIAGGLSNPEIADRLVVSRRTVEHHVSHILTKLGVSSRTQAATYAVRRTLGSAAG